MRVAGRNSSRHAFTLTEVTIVLGIVGTILGAIWGASARVSNNNKMVKASTELMSMASTIRSLYGSRPFPSGAQKDITCSLVGVGVFLPEMIPPGACAVGNHPLDPWGGQVNVYSSTSAADASATQFELQMGLPDGKTVTNFLTLIFMNAQSAGITNLFLGDGIGWLPVATMVPENLPVARNGNFSSDWKLQP